MNEEYLGAIWQILSTFSLTGQNPFWQSWGAAPRFAVFPTKITPGRADPPSAPPAPKTCTVTQTYRSGSPAVSGAGEGQGVVLLGAPQNENFAFYFF